MPPMKNRAVFLVAFLLVSACWATAHASESGRYFERKEEGWFWKNWSSPQEKQKPAEPLPPPLPTPAAPESAKPAGPAPLSTAWLRQNLEHFRDNAIDHPSEENVLAYKYLERLAIDRASRYAAAEQKSIVLDPILDESRRAPRSEFARGVSDRVAEANRDAVLKKIADGTGIWFFYRSDCPYCEREAPILVAMERLFGFNVTAISLDHLPLPSGLYPDFIVDEGQSERLAVTRTPTIVLASPPDKILKLSEGMLDIRELGDRIMVLSQAAGWITSEEMDSTIPIKKDWLTVEPEELAAQDMNDPKELVKFLRKKLLEDSK